MSRTFLVLIVLTIFNIRETIEQDELSIIRKRNNHASLTMDDLRLSLVTQLSNIRNFNEILDNILVPRVPGTPGHDQVRDYIVKFMSELRWATELDTFTANTPIFGKLRMDNIIATLNPNAERFLILACHYDSKYFDNAEFLGATDSAVPCAMLLNMAMVLKDYLANNRQNNEVSIKFLFFDGEEAFVEWTDTDSIYGAKHLAQKWERERFLPKIDMLVLLDLLGTPDPQIYSYYQSTEKWYRELLLAEERLASLGYLERYQYSSVIVQQSSNRYFQPRSTQAFIEDDHTPFLKRNVPILHIIPIPFPDVWHKQTDNRDAVDLVTSENLMKIFRVFILEYLHIPV